MVHDKLGGIVRAAVGVPQDRLPLVQKVLNGLHKEAKNGDQFQVELSKFVLGWKPAEPEPKPEVVVIPADPDLARWVQVYQKLFSMMPDLSNVRIPAKPEGFGPMRLIVVAREIVEWTGNYPFQGVQNALKKHFKCWQYDNDLDHVITANDRAPYNGSYAVWVKDVCEADEEFANKSAYDLATENHTGIVLIERQLLEADYFFEKGKHLDEQNVTLCSGSRDRDGDVPRADWYGKFHVRWCRTSDRDPVLRSRRVWA